MTPPTGSDPGAFAAPDPRDFALTATALGRLPLVDGDRSPFHLDEATARAADGGHLVAGRTRLVAATGTAAVLELARGLDDERALRDVTAWLRELGDAAVAVGGFPFDRSAPARLVVPSRALCRAADGSSWSVEVRRLRGTEPGRAVRSRDGSGDPERRARSPRHARVREVPAGARYEEAVAAALAEIADGSLSKVVLARALDATLPSPVDPSALLATLWRESSAFAPYSVPTATGRLVGASPELLIGRRGRRVLSHAFAGTIGLATRTSVRATDEDACGRLLASTKDRGEHRLVVEEVTAALARRCSALDVPREPSVMRLGSDARLGTLVRGTLRDDGEGTTALSLLSLLHPTPAVGGVPRDGAIKTIAALEPFTRGPWAGAVGWIDAHGDGEWVLAIRSALLDDDGIAARLYAGAGIVAGSSPPLELAETTLKLAPVLEALWPGAAALLERPDQPARTRRPSG